MTAAQTHNFPQLSKKIQDFAVLKCDLNEMMLEESKLVRGQRLAC